MFETENGWADGYDSRDWGFGCGKGRARQRIAEMDGRRLVGELMMEASPRAVNLTRLVTGMLAVAVRLELHSVAQNGFSCLVRSRFT